MKQMWLLTAVLMVGLLAGGYFLLVSPKKGQVTKLHANAETQRKANDVLKGQISLLEAQAKSLPAKQNRLAEIEKKIPSNPALPALVRSLTKSGRETGMFLEILEPTAPVFLETADLAPVAPAKPGTADAAAATTPSVDVGKLAMVPIRITAWGNFAETQEFLSELESLKRTLMVTNAEITYTPPATQDGTPSPGDLKVVLDARVYMRAAGSGAAAVSKPAKPKTSASSATNE
jgi:Tfp pilus assembly protein PilO